MPLAVVQAKNLPKRKEFQTTSNLHDYVNILLPTACNVAASGLIGVTRNSLKSGVFIPLFLHIGGVVQWARPLFQIAPCRAAVSASGVYVQTQRVDLRHQVRPQRRMNGAMAGDPAFSRKLRRAQRHMEMALPRAIIAAVSRVPRTVIAHLQNTWLKGRFEFPPDVVSP